MHLTRKRYLGMAEQGLYRMPTALHLTYCGLSGVTRHDVDTVERNVDCDECIQAKAWEDIDAAVIDGAVKV